MPEYPNQRLIDYLSRSDELQIKNIEVLKGIQQTLLRGLPGTSLDASIKLSNLIDLKTSLMNNSLIPYTIKTFAMDTAATDQKVVVEGTNLVAATDGTLDGCFVRFNNQQSDRSPLKYFDWDLPFFELYVTWLAQAGKTLYLAIGKQAGAKGTARSLGGFSSALAPELLYNAMPGASPVYSTLTDWRGAKRIVLQITSTMDVACSIQVVGNINNATASATDINGAVPLAIGNVTTQYATVGLAWDDWHPYIGARITCPVLPAAGLVTIWAVQQE